MPDIDLSTLRRNSGGRNLAPYACIASETRGRLIDEPRSATRTDFQRDRDRIIHSDAFRRLKHKTQVFIQSDGDHFRTRLTHTIEVGQIARALARSLRVDEDLAEALALVHDFGHTPFGHAGERVLEKCMAEFGGFDHNAQSLRIVTSLEHSYASFNGLNLTWETLEGLVKHNGPLIRSQDSGLSAAKPLPDTIADYNNRQDLWLSSWPSVEAQCAAIADDIAYDGHDLDDGLRAGLFELEDVEEVSLCSRLMEEVRNTYPALDPSRARHELVRRQITCMIEDVLKSATQVLNDLQPNHADKVRNADRAVVGFSNSLVEEEAQLKAFLFSRMYRSPQVMQSVEVAEAIVEDLFTCYMEDDKASPSGVSWHKKGLEQAAKARMVADYIAGMTDRFALRQHRDLFPDSPLASLLLD